MRAALIAFVATFAFTAHAIADSLRRFDIPPGDLAAALDTLAKQSGVELMYSSSQVKGLRTEGLQGEYTPEAAAAKLIAGTSLKLKVHPSGGLLISDSSAPSAPQAEPGPRVSESTQRVDVEEVVVTGTHLRGVTVTSPVITLQQADMRRAGQNSLGDVIRSIPQSFAGGQNPGVASSATVGGGSNQNVTGASSINLRGLGPDATLTLINGNRLPYDGYFQATDISGIPVAAIDRVEILLDGASAIYGTDAVGGVANVLLKRDYNGAEISARYGESAHGGYVQNQYTGIGGTTWSSGGVLVTGDYASNTALLARNRSYLDYLPNQRVSIYPELTQKSALASGHQSIGDGIADIGLDALVAKRTGASVNQDVSRFSNEFDASSWMVAPRIDVPLPAQWSLSVRGSVGRNRSERSQTQFDVATGAQLASAGSEYINRLEVAGVEAEGPLMQAPGGDVRLSAGAGYRRTTFRSLNSTSGATTGFGSDRSLYEFAEVNVPLVAPEAAIPFVSRLALNAAVRHEDYDSFGTTTTPKLGLLWGVTQDFDVKASWGKSFKVPTLLQQNQEVFTFLVGPAFGAPEGKTIIWEMGGNNALTPERATVLSAGIAAHPERVPGLAMELNWFRINYRDRVVEPLPGALIFQALANPELADFVTLNPSLAQQNAVFAASGLPVGSFTFDLTGMPFDPAALHAIVDDRLTNAAEQRMHGLDLSLTYSKDLSRGVLSLFANGNWMEGTRRSRRLSPSFDVTGVAYFPAKLRTRAGVSWSDGPLTVSTFGNYIDGVANNLVSPATKGASMTTFDLVLDYQLRAGVLGDIGLNLAAINVFDRSPPWLEPVQAFDVNYDSTNYSALGRVVSATVRKAF